MLMKTLPVKSFRNYTGTITNILPNVISITQYLIRKNFNYVNILEVKYLIFFRKFSNDSTIVIKETDPIPSTSVLVDSIKEMREEMKVEEKEDLFKRFVWFSRDFFLYC